jgi:hypothetical protein
VTHLLAGPNVIRRLVVLFCVAVTLAAVAVRLPETFADANRAARANASLDWVDRQLGGGNSVLPDQGVAIEASGRIPERETFDVDVGEPPESWSELSTPDALETYMRYFLLPRRPADGAPWIICFACDPNAHPGATTVWQDDESISILRRGT